ncbi:NAD(P)-binding protein [Atractiella rhizophila]|nr:NAD(P)-binding protein [Atractiella rhizophila]
MAFAANNAIVYIVGRRKDRLETAAATFENSKSPSIEGKIIPLVGDVGSKEKIAKLVKDYEDKEQVLHVLINGAGVSSSLRRYDSTASIIQQKLWDHSEDDFFKMMNTHVASVYWTSVDFIHLLQKGVPTDEDRFRGSECPCIINLSSLAGNHISRIGMEASYSSSKAATQHLTRVLAGRFMPLHIRVNCIAPGLFPSEMSNLPEDMSNFDELPPILQMFMKNIPEGRAGSVADIAGPAIMMASRAGAYINGAILAADGGRLMVASAKAG